jgi:hypothetical protein
VVYARVTPSWEWGGGEIFKINVNIVIIMTKNLLMYKKLFSKGRVKYLKAGARLIFVVDSQLKLYLSMQPWSLMSRIWLDPCPAQSLHQPALFQTQKERERKIVERKSLISPRY